MSGATEANGSKEGDAIGGANASSEKKVPFYKLFSFADRWDYILMAIGSLGACAHGVSVPVFFIFFGKLINSLGLAYLDPPAVSGTVAKYSLDFVYLAAVTLFSSWTEVACWMYTGERQATRMRLAYLRAMLSQDVSFFDTESSGGEVVAAITGDVIIVQDAISEKVGNFMHYISRFIGGFAIGFKTVWQLTLVTLGIVPLIALAGGLYAFAVMGLASRGRKAYIKAGGIAEEVIGNVRTVYAFVGEEKAVESYKKALMETYEIGKKSGLAKGFGLGTLHAVLFMSWALLVWYTSRIVHQGVVDGGEAFTTMLNVVISGLSLGQAAPNLTEFGRARAAGYSIFEMIQRSNSVKSRPGSGERLHKVDGNLELRNVRFSYPSRPDVVIFENLSFHIPAGKVVAIVGGSGSGKSTVISLIERFYDPQSGELTLDGHDIKSLELRWLRQQIGLVNQEPALFATSIGENILYGKDDATMEEMMEAAKLSDAALFINNLPDRYETQVGERGVQLSGGQKQRIAISRAILKNPSILLLDEATSALDAESEKSVQEALDRVMVGRTTVVVAHRLSTIRNADIIAVVKDGKIVESGNHQTLISKEGGAYAALVNLQESQKETMDGPSLLHSRRASRDSLSRRTFSFGASVCSDRDSLEALSKRFGMEKIEDEKPVERVPLTRLFKLALPDRMCGVLGASGAIFAGAQTPFFALGVSQALVAMYDPDYGFTKHEIRRITLLFCSAAVVTLVAHVVEHLNFGMMGERLTMRVREMMFSAILRNEVGWFDDNDNNSGVVSSRLASDATMVKILVVDRLTILIQNASLIITALTIAFIEQWRITLVVMATYPLLVIAQMSERFFMEGYAGNLSKAYLKANMVAAEAVSNIRTVAAFCAEEKVIDLFSRQLEEPRKRSFRRGQIAGICYGTAQFCMFSSYGLALWYSSTLIRDYKASFGSVMKTFMVLIVTALSMAESLAMAPDIIKGTEAVSSVFEIVDRKSEIPPDDPAGEDLPHVDGHIELKHVHFSYPARPDVAIFKDFNLRVRSGRTVAVVGSSGSGKSSILALILRFYDPTAGKVTVDGKDLRKLSLKSLRKHIGLVQQEPALFATTIYDNIMYGRDGATEAEIIEAAISANAHSFISSLPEGYRTEVGERGVQLSGGQKQRVAIARAVLKNPAILLLDEATSALDAEAERVVQAALNGLMKNRTTIMVAHRLSTVQNAHVICVLQDGKVVEQGSHETLVGKDGAYSKLISLQQHR
uniref:TSA: Wollemia nobilis Ref_Wollemi_Transcript_18635_3947 transcribed RNA sequence n=1 Tax=Wollemia nobilis TaxID=56998 RepID=A0A0C9RIA8_9CONI